MATPGLEAPLDVDTWVEAAPFRAHLRHLMAVGGLSCGGVALLTGISPRLAAHLVYGRGGRSLRRISPDTARKLLRVSGAEAAAVRRRSVPASTTTTHLRWLHGCGWSERALAERLGLALDEVAALLDGSAGVCTQRTALHAAAEASSLPTPLAVTRGASGATHTSAAA